jgi:hypothetical protein
MALKQSTFEEIVESERELILAADQRYGKYYLHASAPFFCRVASPLLIPIG